MPHQPRTSPHVSGQDYSHSASHCTPRAETSKCEYQLNRGVSVAGTDIAALHLFLQTLRCATIGRTVVIPISDAFLVDATGATRLLLHLHHIVDRIPILTAAKVISGTTAQAGATPLHLHLHPIVDLTRILLAARSASGTMARTGVTLLTTWIKDKFTAMTPASTPPTLLHMVRLHQGMTHTRPTLLGRDTHRSERGAIM